MNIVIVGQGAIGLLLYHFIDKNINNDSLTLRPSYSLTSPQIEYHFTDLNNITSKHSLTYADNNEITYADIILFTVKSYQVKQAIADIIHLLPSKAMLIMCHNGMGVFEELPESLIASHQIMTLLTTHGCLRKTAFNIIHTGLGQIDFGLTVKNSVKNEQTNSIISTLKYLLAPATFHDNIIEKQWLKLAINCVINPLTTVHDIDNGEVNNKEFESISAKILNEVVLVAKTQGILFELNWLINQVREIAQATKKNSSSMRCDIANNKPSEIDYINGYIHRLGQQHNILTPVNTQLWRQVSKLQSS